MTDFKKILIANRGEIAIRIMRAANEMGKQTFAVFAEGKTITEATGMGIRLGGGTMLPPIPKNWRGAWPRPFIK